MSNKDFDSVVAQESKTSGPSNRMVEQPRVPKSSNNNKLGFWLNITLGILFVMTVVSLGSGHQPDGISITGPQTGMLVHCIAGTGMLIGVICHLVLHKDWIKNVFSRTSKNLSRRVRLNRNVDLALFVSFLLCNLAGAAAWVMPNLGGWNHLHQMTGIVTLIILLIHLALHWRWIVTNTGRRLKDVINRTKLRQRPHSLQESTPDSST